MSSFDFELGDEVNDEPGVRVPRATRGGSVFVHTTRRPPEEEGRGGTHVGWFSEGYVDVAAGHCDVGGGSLEE